MSRWISIQATYLNNIQVNHGVYSPTNGEYFKSLLDIKSLAEALERFKEATKGRKYKNLKIIHNISVGDSSDESIYFEYYNPKLTMKEMLRQIKLNKAALEPFLD